METYYQIKINRFDMNSRIKEVRDLIDFLEDEIKWSSKVKKIERSYYIFIDTSSFKKFTNRLEEIGIEYTVL